MTDKNHFINKIRVGITGQAGFMGTHLYNYLGLKENILRIPFEDQFFDTNEQLDSFVKECDVVVHLAAMNRHGDPQVIYDTNIKLVNDLLSACERTNSTPHIIFASSTQEVKDNLYGKSKKDGREILQKWAKLNNARFTALIIPNVFGPFGNPYYNSVIATFSHQLTHNEKPEIQIDGELKLIYINELVEEFWEKIVENSGRVEGWNGEKEKEKKEKIERYKVPHTSVNKVSDILKTLEQFKVQYFKKGVIPKLNTKFELNLFNTFRCYIGNDLYPFKLTKHTDERGSFTEIIRTNTSGQFSFSTTKPGITRGNHFHTRKIERFAVIKGKAKIEIRRIGTNEVIEYILDGNEPAYVDMPIWSTHNITNIGDEELFTLFWINEPYDETDPDTYFEQV